MAFKFTAPSRSVPLEFSTQQIRASEEMRNNFAQGVVRYNILLAQMQSGKTETYLLTAWEMVRTGKVENVIIFSGNSEIYLKEQLATTLRGSVFEDKYEAYLKNKKDEGGEGFVDGEGGSLEPRQVLRALKEWAQFDSDHPKIQILWGTEMKKYRGPREKTLFIWEESHYAQTTKQSPDKFLQDMGISPDGNLETFIEKDNYMVSISATPFSELSDLHHLDQSKKVVFMLPGDGYNSVKRMRDNGRIKTFESLTEGIIRALSYAETTRTTSYAIIRITQKTTEETEEIIRQHNATINRQQQWRVFYFDSVSSGKEKEDGDRVWKNMSNVPQQNTIILIRGKCRMGHDLSKKYLSFVMETSKKPNTDTLLQGLLGRACGYPRSAIAEEDNIYQVEVYLYEKIIKSKEIDRYIEMVDTVHDGLISVLPKKAKNLINGITQISRPIIPIRVSRTDINNNREQVIQHVVRCISEQRNIENKNDDEDFTEMREKIMRISGDTSKFKVFYLDDKKKTRNGKKAQMILDAFEQSQARDFGSGCGMDDINDTEQINIWVPKKVVGVDVTKLFITSHVSIRHHDTQQITISTRKEVFACRITKELTVEANGGFAILLPIESAFNIQVLQQKMIEFIDLSIQHETSRQIRSLWDLVEKQEKGILLSPAVFASLQKKGSIYELIKKTYGLQLKLTKTRGRIEKSVKESGLVKLESISW